jgi:hypothetical protein
VQDPRRRRRADDRSEESVWTKYRKTILLAVAALVVLSVGYYAFAAWRDSAPRMYQVTGTVTIDGKPADLVTVYFWPLNMGNKRNFEFKHATAVTDPQGRFSLKAGGGETGIAAGDYKVTFSRLMIRGKPVGAERRKKTDGAVEAIPEQFRDENSKLNIVTVSSTQQDFPFDVPLK